MIRKVKKNPKNEYLLKDLAIRKGREVPFDKTEFLTYSVFYPLDGKNILIGKAYIRSGAKFVSDITINKDFQRQGVASFLYDYIEKDLNIKLAPVQQGIRVDSGVKLTQKPDGKAFWENRLKRKNPTDFDFWSKIIIDKETFKFPDGTDKIIYYQYNVYLHGKRMVYEELVKGQNTVDDINVLKPYQRKGLTTFLYDYIEKDLKIKLKPSEYLDPDGKKFWESRLKSSKR